MVKKDTLPIVKISFIGNNRVYEVGLKTFLKVLDLDLPDAEIMVAVRKILISQQ